MSQPPPWTFDPASQTWYWVDRTGRRIYQDLQTPGNSAQDPRWSSSSPRAANARPAQSTVPYASGTDNQSARPISDDSNPLAYTFARQPGSSAEHRIPATYNPTLETVTRDFGSASLQDPRRDGQPGSAGQGWQQQRQQQQPPPTLPVNRYRTAHGTTITDFIDPRNQVRSRLETGPANQVFTDPTLAQKGINSHMMLMGTEGEEEVLFKAFRKREKPRMFFTRGKVFRVLWSEPAGESNTDITMLEAGTSLTRFNELVYSKVRRFVVVREGDTYCSALPIMTYGRRGVSKPGTKKCEHSIIYTGKIIPALLPQEVPQHREEKPMRPGAIRVNTDDPREKLEATSRIDYGKVYTIQHNIKVANFGKVHPNSMHALLHQFRDVWDVEAQTPSTTDPSTSKKAGKSRQDSVTARERDLVTTRSKPDASRRGTGTAGESGAHNDATKAIVSDLMNRGYSARQALEYVLSRQQLAQARNDESEDETEDRDECSEDEQSDEQGDDEDHHESREAFASERPRYSQQTTASRATSTQQVPRATEIGNTQSVRQQRQSQAYASVTNMARRSDQTQMTETVIRRMIQHGYTVQQAYLHISDEVARFVALRYDPDQALNLVLNQLLRPPQV